MQQQENAAFQSTSFSIRQDVCKHQVDHFSKLPVEFQQRMSTPVSEELIKAANLGGKVEFTDLNNGPVVAIEGKPVGVITFTPFILSPVDGGYYRVIVLTLFENA